MDESKKPRADDYDRPGFAKWRPPATFHINTTAEKGGLMWQCPNDNCGASVNAALIICPRCGWKQPTKEEARHDRLRGWTALILCLAVVFGFGFWRYGWNVFGLD